MDEIVNVFLIAAVVIVFICISALGFRAIRIVAKRRDPSRAALYSVLLIILGIAMVSIVGSILGGCSEQTVTSIERAVSGAPSEDEVAKCQKLLDNFEETIEESKKKGKKVAMETAQSAIILYSITDCPEIMERAREHGMVPEVVERRYADEVAREIYAGLEACFTLIEEDVVTQVEEAPFGEFRQRMDCYAELDLRMLSVYLKYHDVYSDEELLHSGPCEVGDAE